LMGGEISAFFMVCW